MFKRFVAVLISVTFIFSNCPYTQAGDFSINQLPMPGSMVGVSSVFSPLALKGIVINPQKPLEFQFIVDTGEAPQDAASVKVEAKRLVKYFLAGLTIPEGELWVNLSPYEKSRITTTSLGQTELGRDLLAQDYILKQLTASLIYPENGLGKEFWGKVYDKAEQRFGTTNIPVNTFNKVWILPDQAQIFQNGAAAYVTKSTLKVMLDEDYVARQKHHAVQASGISSQVVRDIVIPEIEKEVNNGKNFAPLRQIYDAMILAKWYKETIQNGLLDAVYTNKKKIAGVNMADPGVKELIYQRYLMAYKKGVFNYIKEDSASGRPIPRKYFSGGITNFESMPLDETGRVSAVKKDGAMMSLTVVIEQLNENPGIPAPFYPSLALMSTVQAAQALKPDQAMLSLMSDNPGMWLFTVAGIGLFALVAVYQYLLNNTIGGNMYRLKRGDVGVVGSTDYRSVEKFLKDHNVDGKKIMKAYIDALSSGTLEAQLHAAEKLGTYRNNKDVFSALLRSLDLELAKNGNGKEDLVLTEIVSLGKLKDIGAVGRLIKIVESSNSVNKIGAAAQALGDIGDAKAAAPLINLYDDSARLKTLYSGANSWHNPEALKIMIIRALGKIGTSEARGFLMTIRPSGVPGDNHITHEIDRALEGNGSKVDRAMIASEANKGGIDLNQINVNRGGKKITVGFDPVELEVLMQSGFRGFTPVIKDITPISSPLSLLGVGPAAGEEK
jgi:hypothetical protein